ncbi:hypothetical protein A7X83_06070 [Stenotrophomonas maltophilia]|uniref:Uncharacterized protein n=1 Tax=Stenotrophomonas maltophilia TaxID=40324 RepID=A0A2W6ICL4_STEMA|nr:hypothetical protein A7X83_06070 [Stenotrophomonas maltophilia]
MGLEFGPIPAVDRHEVRSGFLFQAPGRSVAEMRGAMAAGTQAYEAAKDLHAIDIRKALMRFQIHLVRTIGWRVAHLAMAMGPLLDAQADPFPVVG